MFFSFNFNFVSADLIFDSSFNLLILCFVYFDIFYGGGKSQLCGIFAGESSEEQLVAPDISFFVTSL